MGYIRISRRASSKTLCWTRISRIANVVGLGGAWGFAFLIKSQVITLLVMDIKVNFVCPGHREPILHNKRAWTTKPNLLGAV